MCNAVSGLIDAGFTIHLPDPATWIHSHSALAERVGIVGNLIGDKWARFELSPKDGDFKSDVATWTLRLDEQRRPEWWDANLPEIEDKIRRAVSRYMDGARASGSAPGSTIANDGDSGSASATGDRGSASATGYRGSASATGDSGSASATGYRGSASATGDNGSASATGYSGSASATGYRGSASATGYRGSASAMGYGGSASATGYGGSASIATGYRCAVCGVLNSALLTAERNDRWELLGWAFGVVDGKSLLPNVWYEAKGGKLVECSKERVAEIEYVRANAGPPKT